MTTETTETLLEFYQRELTYLRREGLGFARTYPKVAGRLELGMEQCPDPHIERLIESFAFLTARLQYDLDSEFPQLAGALLGTVYPHFATPIPSMTVAGFEVDHTQGKLTSGHLIPKNTPLFAQTETGQHCRFKTCYPVTLWPVELAYAGFESTHQYDFLDRIPQTALVLRLRIQSPKGVLAKLALSRLRFFINADRMLANSLYELIFDQVYGVALLPENGQTPRFLPPDAILPVGFEADEDVLPYPPNASHAYRLLQEYFTFPEKYLFFDIDQLDTSGSAHFFDILILLDRIPDRRLTIQKETFRLGCTPIINLFHKTTDPIRLDQKRPEYLLVPDQRRLDTTEIHSILSVSGIADESNQPYAIEPYYSYNHNLAQQDQKAFWHARRIDTGRADLPGTQIMLSLVDFDFNPRQPANTIVYAHTLCTNRRLAEELPAGAILQIESAAPTARITALSKPTLQITPPLGGPALWRLISHLSLNHLSLSNDTTSLEALREILRLYSFTEPQATHQQVNGIRAMECRHVMRRMGLDAWRGFVRGIEVTLTFDERMYVGSGAFMLAGVINRFLPLYVSINSFTQLKIKSVQREGIWKEWQPMAGEQSLL